MPTSTIEDNDRLLVLLQRGDTNARQEMIERNMPLVVKCVERMVKRYPKLRRHFDDLVGVGFLVLTEAVQQLTQEKVNPDASISPTGYLKTSIYRGICREICQSGTIRIPQETINLWRHQGKLTDEDNPIPTIKSLESLQADIAAGREIMDSSLIQDDPGLENFEAFEAVLQCCRTDLERKIILLRAQNLTMDEVGRQVNRDESRVSRILAEIQQRYMKQ